MLVLKRAIGEVILCELPDGRTVLVRVLGIDETGVKLGVDAPRDIEIVKSASSKVDNRLNL